MLVVFFIHIDFLRVRLELRITQLNQMNPESLCDLMMTKPELSNPK